MPPEKVQVWKESANAHAADGHIEAFCWNRHALTGRDEPLLFARVGTVRLGGWCAACLSDLGEVRREIGNAGTEQRLAIDLDGAMLEIRRHYRGITGKEPTA